MSGDDGKVRQRVKRRVRVRVERVVPLRSRIRLFWQQNHQQVTTVVLMLLVPLAIWMALAVLVGE